MATLSSAQPCLTRLSDGPGNNDWYHLDDDQDHTLDNGEMIFDVEHNHRYVIESTSFPIDETVHALKADQQVDTNTVLSAEMGDYKSWEEVQRAGKASGADTIYYRRQDGSYTWRMIRNTDGTRNYSALVGDAKQRGKSFAGINTLEVYYLPASRSYTIENGQFHSPTYVGTVTKPDGTLSTVDVPVRSLALTLKSTVSGQRVSALWRADTTGAWELSVPDAAQDTIDLPITMSVGRLADPGYLNDFPFSEAFLVNYHTAGDPEDYGLENAPSSKKLVSGPEMGLFPTEAQARNEAFYSAYGSGISYLRADGKWAYRLLRIQESNGAKKNLRTRPSDAELTKMAQILGVSQVKYIDAWTFTKVSLMEDPRLAELQLRTNYRDYEAFYHVYDTRVPEEQKQAVLDYVLSNEMQPSYLIDDVICTWWVKKTQRTYVPESGSDNGKVVYMMSAANITHNYISDGVDGDYYSTGHRPARLQDKPGFAADDIQRLNHAGFTVKFVDGASTADMIRAFYDPKCAGIFIDSHGSPGGVSGYAGFDLDIADLDRKKISPNLVALECFGCSFNKPFEASMPGPDGKVQKRQVTLTEYLGPQVYISARDRTVYTDETRAAQQAHSGPLSVYNTVSEIMARTAPVSPASASPLVANADVTSQNQPYCQISQ